MAKHQNYKQYKQLNIPAIEKEVLAYWKANDTFKKSVANRPEDNTFVFYEGPPSANGMPGIHHVISRSIKDVFCRYKTLQGFRVDRKAGWDTHGLPIELQVEKSLGITKDDIGTKISVEDYNAACRKDVLKFKDKWDELTEKIGYWVDLDNPYITYENNYIESVWNLLKRLYDKGLLYKGHTIQPYSPAAGTGLSSHELNQPGTYKDVKDTTVVAQFKLTDPEQFNVAYNWGDTYCIAWTTTPWTLPSNTALGIGPKIDYSVVKTYNPYTFDKVTLVLATKLLSKYFKPEQAELKLEDYESGDKKIPYEIVHELKGSELVGARYGQLMPYQQPMDGDAFKLIAADFVTTEDGTGIVHLAPSFGGDDYLAAAKNGIGSLTLVDKQGKFIEGVGEFSGLYVKNYTGEDENAKDYLSTDVKIAIKLKKENKAFKVEKYVHSYPHCWRTDKPILYYPLESWFIKTTAVKDRLIDLNNTINWKPKSTGTGRFGNWLENLVDWNLSRSRYWGTPLPIWRTKDGKEEKCIGSIEELKTEIIKAVEAGVSTDKSYLQEDFDLHRPFIDDVVLVSDNGEPMYRETDLIDVWFDSGAMPFAQQHYPFENKHKIDDQLAFPADFIAEGVDQTRGWFFTLHAIAVMLNDSVAYKNVMANGLVQDKNGNKMSKRLGNSIDPFKTVEDYGADVIRWYMLSNSSPWDNLKFDVDGLKETQRKFFGTLHNVYGFYALYANIDGYVAKEATETKHLTELDRWILSKLNSVVKEVESLMDDYEPTRATRLIQDFVIDDLSNWYIRLNRRRYWKGELTEDKKAAYDTLFTCLDTISKLISSFSPFYADRLYQDVNKTEDSVHLQDFPKVNGEIINLELEEQITISQQITSLILRIRKLENIKVRQPLGKVLIPALDNHFAENLAKVTEVIKREVNVKTLEIIEKDSDLIKRSAKPNFKVLGPKVGKHMRGVKDFVTSLNGDKIAALENGETLTYTSEDAAIDITLNDIEIHTAEIPGWQVMYDGRFTVALDLTITDELKNEGIARELVNKIQNLRKEKDFEVTDKIEVKLVKDPYITAAVEGFKEYICGEILAKTLDFADNLQDSDTIDINSNLIEIYLNN